MAPTTVNRGGPRGAIRPGMVGGKGKVLQGAKRHRYVFTAGPPFVPISKSGKETKLTPSRHSRKIQRDTIRGISELLSLSRRHDLSTAEANGLLARRRSQTRYSVCWFGVGFHFSILLSPSPAGLLCRPTRLWRRLLCALLCRFLSLALCFECLPVSLAFYCSHFSFPPCQRLTTCLSSTC